MSWGYPTETGLGRWEHLLPGKGWTAQFLDDGQSILGGIIPGIPLRSHKITSPSYPQLPSGNIANWKITIFHGSINIINYFYGHFAIFCNSKLLVDHSTTALDPHGWKIHHKWMIYDDFPSYKPL